MELHGITNYPFPEKDSYDRDNAVLCAIEYIKTLPKLEVYARDGSKFIARPDHIHFLKYSESFMYHEHNFHHDIKLLGIDDKVLSEKMVNDNGQRVSLIIIKCRDPTHKYFFPESYNPDNDIFYIVVCFRISRIFHFNFEKKPLSIGAQVRKPKGKFISIPEKETSNLGKMTKGVR